MARRIELALWCAAVAGASVWMAFSTTTIGDWRGDSWPAIHALSHGHVGGYLSAKAMMGPFATLVQTPFALLGGAEIQHAYRWAALPSLVATGLLGIYLSRLARRRGASRLTQALIVGLCVVNPLSAEALRVGHPEELLTAALAVGAVAAAGNGRRRWAIALLGLALATKQWAVIAVLPALLALPDRRLRAGLGAAAVAALFTVPGLLAAPGAFSSVQGHAAYTGRLAGPWSIWYPLTHLRTEVHVVDATRLVAHIHEAPQLAGVVSHPLIVLLALALPVAFSVRDRRLPLPGADAMGLLALLAALRCILDPVDNLYYHEPLLLALLGWDAVAPRGLPIRGLAGAAFALLFWKWSFHLSSIGAFNAAYLGVLCIAITLVATALLRPRWCARLRLPDRDTPRLYYGFAWGRRRPEREA